MFISSPLFQESSASPGAPAGEHPRIAGLFQQIAIEYGHTCFAIQLAKLAGLTLNGTTSRPGSANRCRKLGDDHIINHLGNMPGQLLEIGFEAVSGIAN